MDESAEKTMMCGKFKRELYHFQAGELPEDEQAALAGHARECECCGQLLACERSFLRGLQGRLSRTAAPPELRVAIREALDREAGRFTFGAWLRAPWLIPAAAALVLSLLFVPPLARIGNGVVPVDREVLLVDLDCDRAGLTYERQRGCTNPLHLNGFKVGPSEYWTIGLDPDSDRGPVVDRDARGHRMHVVGKLYTQMQALYLTRYTDLGAAPVSKTPGPVPVLAGQVLPDS